MLFLNSQELKDLIYRYLDENTYNYALLLDGDWGSGKTHFIKNILIPSIKEDKLKKDAIYISLYGLKNLEDITDCIVSAIVEKKMPQGEKILPFVSRSFKVVTECVGSLLGSDSVQNSDINKFFSPFVDYIKYFFVFDDLERCSMPINEVLGYINYFIEQNSAKVLIVANEKEIGSDNTDSNLVFKYLLASQNSITWPEKVKKGYDSLFTNNNKSQNQIIDLEELKRRSQLINDDNKYYFRIKEKLIGCTVYYRPILSEIVPTIYDKLSGRESNDNDHKFKEIICYYMSKEKHYNLRTLQSVLLLFFKIEKLMETMEIDSKAHENISLTILEATLRMAIHHKKGLPPYDWNEDSEYGSISLDDTNLFGDNFISFRFIQDYIYYATYNEERIKFTIQNYASTIVYKDESEDPSHGLNYYWELEDKEILEKLQKIYIKLNENKYDGSSYPWLVSILYILKEVGLEPISVDNYIAVMTENLSRGLPYRMIQEPMIKKDCRYFNDYTECIKKFSEIAKRSSDFYSSQKINSFFDLGQGWGNKFSKYVLDDKGQFLNQKGFFKYIDVIKCFDTLKECAIKDLSDFRRTVGSIYDFSNIYEYFSGDIDFLNQFKKLLTNTEFDGNIRKLNIKLLITQIEITLKKLEFSNENSM